MNQQSNSLHKYKFKFIVRLTERIENEITPDKYTQYHLCVYNVNTDGKFPFLRYLLTNTGYHLLSFPKLPRYSFPDYEAFVHYSVVFLSGLLEIVDFNEFKDDIVFNGVHEFENHLYIYFDITKCKIFLDEIHLSKRLRIALVDEMVNHRKVCNVPVDKNTIDYMANNIDMCYLHEQKNNVPYELPIVGYVGKSTEKKMKFVNVFGESAKDKTAILGPYYYFTDLENSIKQCLNGKEGGGIVRFALFMGITKYIENLPNEENDCSTIKQERMDDEMLDKKSEILTLRITDHDGVWAETFDSVYLNNIELDDGSHLPDVPMIVVKDYLQQIPLTYHFINTTYDLNDQTPIFEIL